MKIHPDHVEGIRPERKDQTVKPGSTQESFADMLTQEVSKGASVRENGQVAPPPLMGMSPVSGVAPLDEDALAAVNGMEALLDKWEDYADHLAGGSEGGLKQAYAALEEIESGVAELQNRLPENAALQSVADELEILSRTEKIKFNRGDYL